MCAGGVAPGQGRGEQAHTTHRKANKRWRISLLSNAGNESVVFGLIPCTRYPRERIVPSRQPQHQ